MRLPRWLDVECDLLDAVSKSICALAVPFQPGLNLVKAGQLVIHTHTHIHTQALVRDGPRLVTSHIPPCATANRHLYRASRRIFRRIGPAIWVETEGDPEYRT